MVPLFYTWNFFSIYGPIFPHIKMVPLFDIWFLFSQTGTGIQNVVLLFYQSKGYIKGSRAYRNWQKGSGLIFFWCTFSFMISPPAFFFLFKTKNRRKGSGKRAEKKSRQKKPTKYTCENRYHNFLPSIFKNHNPIFRFHHFGFIYIWPVISYFQKINFQFSKIANRKNQFQKFCGSIFYPPIFFSEFLKIKNLEERDAEKEQKKKGTIFLRSHFLKIQFWCSKLNENFLLHKNTFP